MMFDYSQEWELYIRLMEERPEAFAESEQISIVRDLEIVKEYEQRTHRKIGVVYKSPYNILVVDLVRNKSGDYFAYERMLPAIPRGAVVTIPVEDGRFILLKQFRHAIRRIQYAFPRGFGEEGYTAASNAEKEIREELGAEVLSSVHLGDVTVDSGLLATEASVFYCTVTGASKREEYEGIVDIVWLSDKELQQWIAQGKITDSFTLASIGMLKAARLR